jgi:predicted metal-dependent hydrolase
MNLFRSHRYAPGDIIEVAGQRVRLRVSPRATRIGLKVDQIRREVIASAPNQRGLADAVAFAGQRAAWISAQIRALPAPGAALAPSGVIEVLGRPHRLEQARTRLEAGFHEDDVGMPVLRAFGEGDAFGRAAIRLLRRHALEVLLSRTRLHASTLGQPEPRVAVMDAKGRWGSCRPARAATRASPGDAGSIRYSWRLVLAPFEVADYVVVHECAHLIEANHGPRFWSLVRQVHGSEKPGRAWLRAHGARLHAFGRDG